jgi:hypothetical protein
MSSWAHSASGHAAFDLVCTFLAHTDDAEGAATLRDVPPALWQAALDVACAHHVAPFLYHRARQLDLVDSLPDTVLPMLRHAYLATAADNMRLYHLLHTILDLLRQHGIPVVVLKGGHLAEIVYGNIGLRPMGDLDLLVHWQDLLRLEDVLLPAGYRQTQPHLGIDGADHHVRYAGPKGDLIEFHWDLLDPLWPARFDVDRLWAASSEVSLAGTSATVLSAEDLLLHLCAHPCMDRLIFGLKTLCDISETAYFYRGRIDWQAIRQRSQRWQLDRCAYLMFQLAHDLLSVPVPGWLLESLRPPDLPESALRLVREQLVMPDNFGSYESISRLWGGRSWGEKVRLVLERLFPSRRSLLRNYPQAPDSIGILRYYPVRWGYQLAKFSPVAWRLIRGESEALSSAQRQNRLTDLRDYLFHA